MIRCDRGVRFGSEILPLLPRINVCSGKFLVVIINVESYFLMNFLWLKMLKQFLNSANRILKGFP